MKAPPETAAVPCCIRLFELSVSHGVTLVVAMPPVSTNRWLVFEPFAFIATMAKSPFNEFL
jgi:hypothetical protein